MTSHTLIRRSLRFYWRSHLGVVIGAAIGSAALIGALIVGDSVKGSLRERALERLGQTQLAVSIGDRFVSTELVNKLRHERVDRNGQPVSIAGIIQLRGTAATADNSSRVNHMQLIGADAAFWALAKSSSKVPPLAPNEVLLNSGLARQLSIEIGDEILVRVPKPSALSQDVVLSGREDSAIRLRLRVIGMVDSGNLGNFALAATAIPPLNAFVALETLETIQELSERVNVLLVVGNQPKEEPYRYTSYLEVGLAGAFREHWSARDVNFEVRSLTNRSVAEVASSRVFLDPPLVRSALAAGTNAEPILTYLANLIITGTNATPYSMVTAAGAPWTPTGLRDDEIVLNQWLADDLYAKPGDALSLVYFDPESGARLTERTNTFRIHSIVPMQMPWADRTLMPQFPGIEKAETTAEWDTAFPLVHPIRSQDDDYWTEHRGTPKAFITLAAGQKLWANRFGNLTAIRFPVPTNLISSTTALTPALSPGERGNLSPSSVNAKVGDSLAVSVQLTNAQSLVPLPGGEGQGEGERSTNSIEVFRAALEKKVLATLKPEELGLRFEPVREQALKAAEQSQDFGGLFIGFSLFVIVAALMLMALLFQFSLEQRATEIGTLLALGFTPKQVRRFFLREGAALAFVGGILGTLGGIGYARGMLHGLSTIWRDAVGASTLKFFVTPQTLVIGLLASTIVAVFTLWFALRKQARQPARVLLTGEDGGLKMEGGAKKRSLSSPVGVAALISAMSLIGWMLIKGDSANPGAFFGAGALTLIAGLCLLNAWFVRLLQPSSILHSPSSSTLAIRGFTRRRSRNVATVAMLACGTFLIVSIGVFRLDANRDAIQRTSGTGGFALIGESTMPVVADLNTKAGRETIALNESDFLDVNVVQFRVRQGDEASCLNLNRAQKPRLLGVNPDQLKGHFTFAKGEEWLALSSALRTPHSALEVPAIGDAASIQWAMGKKVGDTLDYVDERGQPFKVRIVGAVANSILQGQLIIDEREFVARFPGESGYKYFLIDVPTNRVADLSAKLSRALQDTGLELTAAPTRLAQFNAVQNTYLGTFQVLGGLGLLLGSAGLGIVVLRNVLERRGELAVLLAVGWRQASVRGLVLREHVALLGLGLLVGLTAAAVAVLPGLFAAANQLPVFTLALTLALVVANGLAFTWLATRYALRGNLLAALRDE
jgi:ABC-type antimicrobial peptide transport system permease subunit